MSELQERAADVPAPSPGGRPVADGGSSDWELFLLRLRYRGGRLVVTTGNRPVLLDAPDAAWVVFSGQVEVFAAAVTNGQPSGARRHLFSARSGAALFGMDLSGAPAGLVASAAPGTELVRVRRAVLEQLAAGG